MIHLLGRSVCGGLACAAGGAMPVMVMAPTTRRLACAQAFCGSGLLALAVGVALPASLELVSPSQVFAMFVVAIIGAACCAARMRRSLRVTGAPHSPRYERALITAAAFGAHNLLEGFITIQVRPGQSRALVATVILLEHLPEGISIAIPVYILTRKPWDGARVAFVVGMLEPIAALCVALWIPNISPFVVGAAHAFVAGIMTFIATAEMIPAALSGIGGASLSSWLGAGVMTAAICDPLLSSKAQEDAVR